MPAPSRNGTTPPPYRHQRDAVRRALELDARCGLFMGMRTGKTRVAIEIARKLGLRRVVVVAPLAAVGVWRAEVRRWAPEARTVTCVRRSVRDRAALLRRVRKAEAGRMVFVLCGWESYWRDPLRSELLRYEPEMMVYDECHRLIHRQSKQSRFAHALATTTNKLYTPPHVLTLSGTPLPNGPENAFSVFKAMAPQVFGGAWQGFADRYVTMGGYGGYKIVGYRNLPELRRKVRGKSYRITTEEALDVPERADLLVPVALTAKTRDVYERLQRDAIAEVEGVQGRGVALSRVVVTNMIRLQQVASGFVKVEDGRIIDLSSEKQQALGDLLDDKLLEAKRVVVYCRWRRDVDAAVEAARKRVGDAVYVMDGRVSQDDRDRQLPWFRTFEPAVLVAQIQVASESIDLSCAHVAVFYSRDFSLVNYDQARARLIGAGQKHKVTYYMLTAQNTIDEKIATALAGKRDLMERLLRSPAQAREFFT